MSTNPAPHPDEQPAPLDDVAGTETGIDLDELVQVLAAAYRHERIVAPQMRRFARAMADLGLPVPADWATVGGDPADPGTRVSFGELSLRTFDRLVCLLEDIADGRPVEVTVMEGGPTLFGPANPPLPLPAPTTPDIHLRVPA